MVADNLYHFVIETESKLPVLVLQGSPDAAANLVPALTLAAPFDTDVRSHTALLPDEDLQQFSAIFLAEVPRLDEPVLAALRDYVDAGGLLVHFPGSSTEINPWNSARLLPVTLQGVVQAAEDERPRPARDVTGADRLGAGLSWVLARRLFEMDADPEARVVATTTAGRPFLVRGRIGQGNVYAFAVSARDDFSNLPKRFAFIVMVRRMLTAHLAQVSQPLAHPALTPLRLDLAPGITRIIAPDGTAHRLPPAEDLREPRTFPHTAHAGIYSVDAPAETEDTEDGEGPATVPVAAVNVPAGESSLRKLDDEALRNIEGILGQGIYIASDDDSDASTGAGDAGARAAFPLAVLAMLMVAGASIMAWHMSRPAPRTDSEEEA
jgi:hypothetical protein